MSTTATIPDLIRRMAEDIDVAHCFMGQAEGEIERVARDIASGGRVKAEHIVALARAIGWWGENRVDSADARAAYYRAGGTDEHLRQIAAESMSDEQPVVIVGSEVV